MAQWNGLISTNFGMSKKTQNIDGFALFTDGNALNRGQSANFVRKSLEKYIKHTYSIKHLFSFEERH